MTNAVTLGEVCEFLDYQRKPVTAKDRVSGKYPYYGANGVQDYVDSYLFDDELVLLAEDGGHFDDPSRGVAYRVSGKCWVNNHAHVLKPKNNIDVDYLYYILREYDVRPFITGAIIKKLNQKDAKRMTLYLPSLEKQKRIVKVLDQADSLRQKRKHSLKFLDEYIKSVFLEMFGDPVSNLRKWEVAKLEDLLSNIDSGWSPKCLEGKASKESWGVLKLSAITNCNYNEEQNKELPNSLHPKLSIEVKSGDLLFSRKNTYELIAATAFVFNTRPKLMLSDLIFRLKTKDTSVIRPQFLWKTLTHSGKRKEIQRLAGGASGSMPNISKAKLKTITIPVPPIDLQLKFTQIVNDTEVLKRKMLKQASDLDLQFQSLLQKAFKEESHGE